MKKTLDEKFEEEFLRRSQQEILKDEKKLVQKQIKQGKPTKQKNIEKEFKSIKTINDASALMAPVVNLASQRKGVTKSKDARVKKLMRKAKKLAGKNVNNPRKYVDDIFSALTVGKKGKGKSSRHNTFETYLNSIDDKRQGRMQSAYLDASMMLTESFNVGLSETVKKYDEYVNNGYGTKEATEKAFKDTEFENDERLKRKVLSSGQYILEREKMIDAENNGMKHKYWRTQRDTRVRHSHAVLDGVIKKKGNKFNVGGHMAELPGDESLPPEERFNCRCRIEYSFVPRGTRKNVQNKTPASQAGVTAGEDIVREQQQQLSRRNNSFGQYKFEYNRRYRRFNYKEDSFKYIGDHMRQYKNIDNISKNHLRNYSDDFRQYNDWFRRVDDFGKNLRIGRSSQESIRNLEAPGSEKEYTDYINSRQLYETFNKFELKKDMEVIRTDDSIGRVKSNLGFEGMDDKEFINKLFYDEDDIIYRDMLSKSALSTSASDDNYFTYPSRHAVGTLMNVKLPKEANAIYLEPVSAFGLRDRNFDGNYEQYLKQDGTTTRALGENEVLVKPFTHFEITDYRFRTVDGVGYEKEELFEAAQEEGMADDMDEYIRSRLGRAYVELDVEFRGHQEIDFPEPDENPEPEDNEETLTEEEKKQVEQEIKDDMIDGLIED